MSDDRFSVVPGNSITNGQIFVDIAPGTPTVGHWCNSCLLPSIINVPVFILGEDAVSPVGEASYCTNCEELET